MRESSTSLRGATRVLIVEDDPSQMRTLRDILRVEGFDPVCCETAADALTSAGNERFPVVILDQKLPDLNGVQLLGRLLALQGDARVIMHTGFGSFETAKDAINLGAFAYIEKMSDPEDLLAFVHRASTEALAQELWNMDGCLRSLTEFAADHVAQVTRSGVVVFLNRDLPGYSMEDLQGALIYDWVCPEYHHVLRESIEQVFRDALPGRCRFTARRPDGVPWWYECRLGPVVSDKKISKALLVIRDIGLDAASEPIEQVILSIVRTVRESLFLGSELSISCSRVGLENDHIAAHPGSRSGAHVAISVRARDGGPATETVARLLIGEPLGKRLGLGLKTIHGLVAGAGGHTAVQTDLDGFTTFTVYIPCPPVDGEVS